MERPVLNPSELQTKVTELMHDTAFLIEIAEACDRAYNLSVGNPNSVLFTASEKDAILGKASMPDDTLNVVNQKMAQNLAGFYALQESIFYLSDILIKNPQQLLEDIVGDNPDSLLMSTAQRFAHATWLAGAAFRGRHLGDNVMVYDILPEDEKMKDAIQIITSSKVLLNHLI